MSPFRPFPGAVRNGRAENPDSRSLIRRPVPQGVRRFAPGKRAAHLTGRHPVCKGRILVIIPSPSTRFRRAIRFASMFGLTMFGAPAMAGVATANMGANVTVSANCTMQVTALNFGSVNLTAGTAVDALGGLNVTCTTGVGYTASAGLGSGSGATFAIRKMSFETNTLNYSLFTDYPRTLIWGDGTGGTNTFSGVGTDTLKGFGIQGRIFAGQASAASGSYSDVVVITVTY